MADIRPVRAMVRDFQYRPYLRLLLDVLDEFNLEDEPTEKNMVLLRFEVLSPDSFMWRLSVGEHVYYLYAEDYISSLDYVQQSFRDYLKSEQWSLVPALRPKPMAATAAVTSAADYRLPDDHEEISKYLVLSGYDQVFLACSQEDPQDAKFSGKAPSGFTRPAVTPEVAQRVLRSQLVTAIKNARLREGIAPGMWVNVVIQGIPEGSELQEIVQSAQADLRYETMSHSVSLGEVPVEISQFSRVGGQELRIQILAGS